MPAFVCSTKSFEMLVSFMMMMMMVVVVVMLLEDGDVLDDDDDDDDMMMMMMVMLMACRALPRMHLREKKRMERVPHPTKLVSFQVGASSAIDA
jgi:hypothetical protein